MKGGAPGGGGGGGDEERLELGSDVKDEVSKANKPRHHHIHTLTSELTLPLNQSLASVVARGSHLPSKKKCQ